MALHGPDQQKIYDYFPTVYNLSGRNRFGNIVSKWKSISNRGIKQGQRNENMALSPGMLLSP